MSKEVKLTVADNSCEDNIHINVITQGAKARLMRIEKEKNMWEVIDAVENPYILMKHKNINCIDALFKCDRSGNAKLHSYAIGLIPLVRHANTRFELRVGKKIIGFSCCNAIEAFENNKEVRRKFKGLDIFEVQYKDEIMTIDCTNNQLLKINISEIDQ